MTLINYNISLLYVEITINLVSQSVLECLQPRKTFYYIVNSQSVSKFVFGTFNLS